MATRTSGEVRHLCKSLELERGFSALCQMWRRGQVPQWILGVLCDGVTDVTGISMFLLCEKYIGKETGNAPQIVT
jgi:hypothetical protein